MPSPHAGATVPLHPPMVSASGLVVAGVRVPGTSTRSTAASRDGCSTPTSPTRRPAPSIRTSKILSENPNDVRLVLRYVLFHQGSEEVARMLEAARMQKLPASVRSGAHRSAGLA